MLGFLKYVVMRDAMEAAEQRSKFDRLFNAENVVEPANENSEHEAPARAADVADLQVPMPVAWDGSVIPYEPIQPDLLGEREPVWHIWVLAVIAIPVVCMAMIAANLAGC